MKSINGNTIFYYVTIDELFNIQQNLKTKYCNIMNKTILTYLNVCIHCQKKSSNSRRSIVVLKPFLHSTFNYKAQIDLTNMQYINL